MAELTSMVGDHLMIKDAEANGGSVAAAHCGTSLLIAVVIYPLTASLSCNPAIGSLRAAPPLHPSRKMVHCSRMKHHPRTLLFLLCLCL